MNSSNYIEQKKNNHLYFQVGSHKYAVNSDNVLEIMKLPALEYPQKLPNNIVGLLKYNNFIINVIDIRFYLDIGVAKYNTNNELLIVKTDETIFGIITDKVIGIIPFDSAMLDTMPYADNNTIIESLYKYEQETIFIINVYNIENLLKDHSKESRSDIKTLFPQDEKSTSVMLRRTQNIAEKAREKLVSGELHTKNNYISFNLNKYYYCISLDYVTEVMKDASITRVPGTPNFIEGIMNLRGDYITVLNLKQFLNIQNAENSGKNPVIIIECNELKLAFLIDKINELFDVASDGIISCDDGYYLNKFMYKENLYTVLNVEKITTDKKIMITDL